MEFNIRFATVKDADAIMDYINSNWKKDHILARDRVLFDWQYGFMNKAYSVVIGENENGEIKGMLGYVPYDDADTRDVVLALWKANENTGFLGIYLFRYLLTKVTHRHILCVGINPDTTEKIYRMFGLGTGKMSHWYRLSPRQCYAIPQINDASIPRIVERKKYKLRQVKSLIEMELIFDFKNKAYVSQVPYKSKQYIACRYFDHPEYSYHVYAVYESECQASLAIVFRLQEAAGERVLRLIDCIGDIYILYGISPQIDELMLSMDAEYVDVYESGLDRACMEQGGWKDVEKSGNIIPDHFSPFEMKNVPIYYASSVPEAVLFKGDGDQDRPS